MTRNTAPRLPHAGERAATILGVLAIVFWGTTVAFSRGLTENLGILTAACAIYLGGGVAGCVLLVSRGGGWRRIASVTPRYWLVCGGSFVANNLCFHFGVGLAHGRPGIIAVGLVNYLWISLTLLMSIPILGNRPRWGLLPGIAMAGSGVALAMASNGPFLWNDFAINTFDNAWPCLLAFLGACAWAVYSNFNRRWEAESGGGPTPVFLLAAGLLFFLLRLRVHENTVWTPSVVLGLAGVIVFPTLLAYLFWDAAMRRGNMVLVVSASYLTPILSTICSCAYCGILPGPTLWLACVLVVAGAALCRRSIVDGGNTAS